MVNLGGYMDIILVLAIIGVVLTLLILEIKDILSDE
jgi:hypothetical protein